MDAQDIDSTFNEFIKEVPFKINPLVLLCMLSSDENNIPLNSSISATPYDSKLLHELVASVLACRNTERRINDTIIQIHLALKADDSDDSRHCVDLCNIWRAGTNNSNSGPSENRVKPFQTSDMLNPFINGDSRVKEFFLANPWSVDGKNLMLRIASQYGWISETFSVDENNTMKSFHSFRKEFAGRLKFTQLIIEGKHRLVVLLYLLYLKVPTPEATLKVGSDDTHRMDESYWDGSKIKDEINSQQALPTKTHKAMAKFMSDNETTQNSAFKLPLEVIVSVSKDTRNTDLPAVELQERVLRGKHRLIVEMRNNGNTPNCFCDLSFLLDLMLKYRHNEEAPHVGIKTLAIGEMEYSVEGGLKVDSDFFKNELVTNWLENPDRVNTIELLENLRVLGDSSRIISFPPSLSLYPIARWREDNKEGFDVMRLYSIIVTIVSYRAVHAVTVEDGSKQLYNSKDALLYALGSSDSIDHCVGKANAHSTELDKVYSVSTFINYMLVSILHDGARGQERFDEMKQILSNVWDKIIVENGHNVKQAVHVLELTFAQIELYVCCLTEVAVRSYVANNEVDVTTIRQGTLKRYFTMMAVIEWMLAFDMYGSNPKIDATLVGSGSFLMEYLDQLSQGDVNRNLVLTARKEIVSTRFFAGATSPHYSLKSVIPNKLHWLAKQELLTSTVTTTVMFIVTCNLRRALCPQVNSLKEEEGPFASLSFLFCGTNNKHTLTNIRIQRDGGKMQLIQYPSDLSPENSILFTTFHQLLRKLVDGTLSLAERVLVHHPPLIEHTTTSNEAHHQENETNGHTEEGEPGSGTAEASNEDTETATDNKSESRSKKRKSNQTPAKTTTSGSTVDVVSVIQNANGIEVPIASLLELLFENMVKIDGVDPNTASLFRTNSKQILETTLEQAHRIGEELMECDVQNRRRYERLSERPVNPIEAVVIAMERRKPLDKETKEFFELHQNKYLQEVTATESPSREYNEHYLTTIAAVLGIVIVLVGGDIASETTIRGSDDMRLTPFYLERMDDGYIPVKWLYLEEYMDMENTFPVGSEEGNSPVGSGDEQSLMNCSEYRSNVENGRDLMQVSQDEMDDVGTWTME